MKKLLLLNISPRPRARLSSNPKPLSFEVSKSYLVGQLSVQRRGWSYAAAAVPSDNAPKGRKRVSKHERRAMVEDFVNRYREMNCGKFPTPSVTNNQIGGSYYFVRAIIQELEYKSKMNSSNSRGENLVKKEPFDESKFLTAEAVKVSSGNTETAKDTSTQDDFQSVVSDDKETVNTGCVNLEEKRGPQTSSFERRSSKEVEIISRPGNQCSASDSNISLKCSETPYPSSLQMPNDVKAEEAVSSYSDSVAPESHLLREEHVSTPFGETFGTDYGKAQGHETELNDMGNHRIVEERITEKAGYERTEQTAFGDLSEEPSHSSLQVPNQVETGEDFSSHSSSDSVASERLLPKEDKENVSASFIEKPDSSCSEAQSHDSKFVDIENHPINEEKSFEKAGYERKEQDGLEDLPGVDGPKHKREQPQRSLELDQSKIDSSNNRENSSAGVPVKSTMWGNLKSFADSIINFWRR